jgi:Tol biopolymer transport system component
VIRPARLAAALLGTACCTGALSGQAVPPYFAPGVITIPQATTYRPTFSPDGAMVIYSMEVGSDYVLLESRRSGGRWTAPRVLPFSGRWSDAEAAFAPDGSRLVFASRRPRTGSQPRADYDLWIIERSPGGIWGTPRPLDELSTAAHELYPALTRSGTLYFARSSPEGSDLYRAERRGDGYAPAEPVASINTDRREAGVWVDADERVMLFDSNRAGAMGGTDIFLSCREGGGWGAARPLPAPVNSAAQETSGVLSPDGRTLYFTSGRRAPGAAQLGPGVTYAGLLRRMSGLGTGRWHTYAIPVPFHCQPLPPSHG